MKPALPFFFLIIFFTSCYKTKPPVSIVQIKDAYGMVDSANFLREHHFWRNYNLQITGDSIQIRSISPEFSHNRIDTVNLYHGTHIVVADIIYMPTDSIDSVWVKVASEDLHQGWLRESTLMENTIPDDPISYFIHYFSDSRLVVAMSLFSLAILFYIFQKARRHKLLIVHFNDIDSPYPTLFCLCISFSAILYGSIQHFMPEQWEHFYFHPTLNPFEPTLLVGIFIASLWLLIIIGIAVLEDLRMQSDIIDKLSYLVGLGGVCMALYLIFSLTVHHYIGYLLFIAYAAYAIISYFRRMRPKYVCGACGRKLLMMGECPHCGAINEG